MTQEELYVLSNPSFPNLYKVGWTEGDSEIRAEQLFTTGVPTPFHVESKWKLNKAKSFEKHIHNLLDEFRNNGMREFFVIDKSNLIEIINSEFEKWKNIDTEKTTMSKSYGPRVVIADIKNKFNDVEKNAIDFINILDINDCFYDDNRLDKIFRQKSYGILDGNRRYIEAELECLREIFVNIENNYDEIKKDIGLKTLIEDIKFVEKKVNDIHKLVADMRDQLSSVL
jgi:hypothetical protein